MESKTRKLSMNLKVPDFGGYIWYSKSFKKAVEKYNKEFVLKGKAFGITLQTKYDQIGYLDKKIISHRITSIKTNGKSLICEFEILHNNKGEFLLSLYENDLQEFVGISPFIRAVISDVKETKGGTKITKCNEIVSIDICHNLSLEGYKQLFEMQTEYTIYGKEFKR